jgi:hypothetical protein
MNNDQIVQALSKLRTSSTFLALKSYRNEANEVADYNIVFHISYKAAIERSMQMLTMMDFKTDLEKQAKAELMASFTKSLTNMDGTAVEDIDDAYTRFIDDDGSYVKGVKLHTATDTLHLYGLVVNKRVIVPGVYPQKKVTQKPLTIAKDKLRHLTSVGKFRQFKILASKLESISVENLSLLPPV